MARILPAYWLALTAVLLTEPSAMTSDALRYVLLLQVYSGSIFSDFTQTWSLCTEVAFYALLPVLARVLPRGRELRYLALAALSCYVIIGGVIATGADPLVLLWLPARLDWFVVGMAVAVAHHRAGGPTRDAVTRTLQSLGRYPGTAWFVAMGILLLASSPIAGPLGLAPPQTAAAISKEVLYAVAAGLVLTACAMGEQDRGLHARVLGMGWLQWLGTISYGIFLWHLLVLSSVFAVTGWEPFHGRMLAVGLLTLVGSIVVASVSWYGLERPLLRFERRTKHRRNDVGDQNLQRRVGVDR
jgi:peptidoglycan/LPS O-acetylase OafA/YrhL